jgi:hypothetical protein
MNISCEKKANGTLFKVSGRMDVLTTSTFENVRQQVIDDGKKTCH